MIFIGMPAPKPQLPAEPLCLIFGDEDFLVRERASQVFEGWCADAGGEEHEIVDGTVRNAAEALEALAKLNEAVQTLPFFGGAKVVWLRAANFLGDERTASSREVTDRLNGLAKDWETFDWQGVQVLISSGKVDKRKAFFKSAKKIAAVEDLSVADKERGSKAALVVRERLAELGKKITSHVADEVILLAGSNLQQLHTEADKLAAYVGGRDEVTRQDVHEIATRTKQAQAFALADALGVRLGWRVEDIDALVRYGLGRRLSVAGPLEIADVAGLDIYSALTSYILPDLDDSTTPPKAMAENVDRGDLGVKTGQGTYAWTDDSSEEVRQRIARALIEIQKWST